MGVFPGKFLALILAVAAFRLERRILSPGGIFLERLVNIVFEKIESNQHVIDVQSIFSCGAGVSLIFFRFWDSESLFYQLLLDFNRRNTNLRLLSRQFQRKFQGLQPYTTFHLPGGYTEESEQ